jgi:hypothetical protein
MVSGSTAASSQPPLYASLEAGLAQGSLSFARVRRRELQIETALGAPLQSLNLDLPETAPDVEDRCALNSGLLKEADHPARGLVARRLW